MLERHRSYKGSVKRRKAPSFTGDILGLGGLRRYVVQPFYLQTDLTADQVKLDPSIDVRDDISFLSLP
jgi:hypothetical protein